MLSRSLVSRAINKQALLLQYGYLCSKRNSCGNTIAIPVAQQHFYLLLYGLLQCLKYGDDCRSVVERKGEGGWGVGGWGMWGVWEGGVHNSSTEQLRGNMTIVLNNIVAY